MSKLVKLTATTLGSDVSTVSIYHTSVTASNLISSSIDKNLLTGSGITFEVADNITTFYAYADSGSCVGFSGSVTASAYSPNTRYFEFFTSGSVDEGGSIDMTSPFTIGPTTSSFTANVNFLTYASTTIDANSGTYPQDTFQGWYYSATSSTPFFTGSTLTLTNTTFTGSDDIYAYFKDIEDTPTATITSLAFSDSSITNASQTINFVVAGTVNGQYTLTGDTGATAPSGTHTIPAGGTNTHSITISANGTGASARSPKVTVATVSSTTTTTFSPVSLQVYDTVSQAAGEVAKAATFSGTQTGPTGTYSAGATLTWSISGTSTVTSGTGAWEHADVDAGIYVNDPGGSWTNPSPNPNTSTSTWSATETSVGPTTPGTYSWPMRVYHNSDTQTNGLTTGTFTVV